MKFNKYQALYLVVLIAAGFLIYGNTLQTPFVLDDLKAIPDNPFIRMEELNAKSIIDAAVGYSGNRPVAMLSFGLNYYLGQYNVLGYHLVNIFIHIITGILFFYFVKLTLTLSNQQPGTIQKLNSNTIETISFFTALLWLVNPIQTQSVTYIVQRMSSMGAMFFILALFLYAKGRIAQKRSVEHVDARSRYYFLWFAGCFMSGLLALGSKESAAMLPAFIFLYEWYFFQDLDKNWIKRQFKYTVITVILIGVVAGLYLGFDPADKFNSLTDYAFGEFTMGQRLLTQARVVVFYLGLIFYPNPSRLNLDHDFSLSYSLFNPITTFLSIVLILGLIGLGIYSAKKQRLISFCIFWYFGNLVIESSIIPLAIIFEHRLYLPSMSIFLIIAILLYRYLKPVWLTAVIACALVAFCSYWTFERNKAWQDPITLWTDCVQKSPDKARPHINLGKALTDQKRYEEAQPYFLKAIRLKPNYIEGHYNLGYLFQQQGKLDIAIEKYREALQIDPNYVIAHNNLGFALLEQNKADEAIESLQRALQLDPDHLAAQINMGIALIQQDQLDAAVLQFKKVLQIDPNLAEAQFRLGAALVNLGRADQGIIHIKKALQIDPDHAEAHNNLGGQLLQQGKMDEALEHLNRALSVKPDLAEAHNNMGIILIQKGNIDAAISHFQDALQADPDFEKASNNLQRAIAIRGRLDTDSDNIQKELEARPDDPVLHFKMGNLHLGKGDLSEAIAEFENALVLQPDFLAARNNLALAYAANRQYERALAAFKKLIELDPANAGAYYNISVLYALQNNVPDSVAWLKRAIGKGYQNWDLIKTDKDLANIRDSEEYKKLVEGR